MVVPRSAPGWVSPLVLELGPVSGVSSSVRRLLLGQSPFWLHDQQRVGDFRGGRRCAGDGESGVALAVPRGGEGEAGVRPHQFAVQHPGHPVGQHGAVA